MSSKKDPILHTYHIKGTNLEAVENATYLGINVAKDLSWNRQVSRVAAKGNRMRRFCEKECGDNITKHQRACLQQSC